MKAHGLARIGREVEVRYTRTTNEAVANIALAFTFGKKGPDGKRPTQWVDTSLWGKRAESIAPYLHKGMQIVAYLEDVHIQTFTKGDGTQGTSLAARLADLELVSASEPEAPAPAPAREPRQAQPTAGFDDMNDDIPF
jgi:single-strand DNA-binding protein